jgi:hypothetical protein
MNRAAGWTIVDRRTNRPVTIVSFLSREGAESQITQWQNRHDRGGRKDVTRESLLNMEPKLISEALPWGSERTSQGSETA